MSKAKSCGLCNHPQVNLMESDYLAGLSDEDISEKYNVSDRSWRAHKSHSQKLKEAESLVKEAVELPEIDEMSLSSEEVRFLSQLYLRRSVARLHQVCEMTDSVRSEQALRAALTNLDKMLNNLKFG